LRRHRKAKLGIEDIARNAVWDKTDGPALDKEFKQIRSGKIAPDFQDKLARKYNDQTARFESTGKIMEPVHVTDEEYDLVTLGGMFLQGQLLCGKTTNFLKYYAAGTGVKGESRADTTLVQEHARVSMLTDGFAEPQGSSMKLGGKFSPTIASATIYEGGSFTQAVGGTMYHRTAFTEKNRVVHTQNQTNFTLSQTISFISIV
jgi:hypothetical protein